MSTIGHWLAAVYGTDCTISGAIRTVATVWQAAEILFFKRLITDDFADFLRLNFTTFDHNNVDQWGGENFRNKILP